VDDAFVARVARLPRLAELVVAGTRAGDGCVDALLAAPALRRAWLWRSDVGAAGLARLATRPGLVADGGAKPDARAAEVEPKPEFVNLLPINVNCPVSGAPVDARRTRVHAGRLVGFCCENCPKDFDADPKKYEGALPKP
jgi:YHS domain-containing protein